MRKLCKRPDCRQPIPVQRLIAAQTRFCDAEYCSRQCKNVMGKRAERARKKAEEGGENS